jgi:hypothetical protein
MVALSPAEVVVSFSETDWLHYLMSERRPNLLVSCARGEMESVSRRLAESCAAPRHEVRLPGRLTLPADACGTLLLWDVATLTLEQQIHLNDWLGVRRPETQVISVTATPLTHLVEHGRFLEGLLHRMAAVSLFAQGW